MTEFLWPLTVLAVAGIAAVTFLVADGRKRAGREQRKVQTLINEDLLAITKQLREDFRRAKVDDLREEVEAIAESVGEMEKNSAHVPGEAWMTDKLKPVYERMNVLSKDLGDLKALFARYEALGKLGKAISGGGSQ